MQKWEYIEVFVNYPDKRRDDSMGRSGELIVVNEGFVYQWEHSGGLLNELGAQGWEMTGVETHTSSSGTHAAKWLFKRPRA